MIWDQQPSLLSAATLMLQNGVVLGRAVGRQCDEEAGLEGRGGGECNTLGHGRKAR